MDFTTFKQTLMQYLPEQTDISIGNDFGINYHILIDNDGYIHLKQKYSFLRVKTSICIKNVEFRKEVEDGSFFMINENNALFFCEDEEEFYFYENGEPSGWGTAYEHFTRFPFGTKTQHYAVKNGELVLE